MSGQNRPQSEPQSFIFVRELSEVYLLLDHISGRYDKTLPRIGDAEPNDFMQQVCTVGWPPDGNPTTRARQAAILLRAKNDLNLAARPANGATIAFTIMVVGGDTTGTGVIADWTEQGWSGSPTRMSLAALAYPGLQASAASFRRVMKLMILAMFGWLLFTCGMSWNIAAGHAILSRIDALAAERTAIVAKIDAGDADDGKTPSDKTHWAPFCDRHRDPQPAGIAFDSATALRLCQPLEANIQAHRVAYANLADWLKVWSFVKFVPHLLCGGTCLAKGSDEVALTQNATDEQWASILNEVLASAVLPICYGILGAAAAIVRELWRKMHNSLLSPRDLTLSLGQLALGAVIGACIGLFVTPSGTGTATQAAPMLTGTVSLSASALSFIAGFGVESVFVALEGFIKRVFNATPQARST